MWRILLLVACVIIPRTGLAQYATQNVTFLSQLTLGEIGGTSGVEGSDIWGWTDPLTSRDYALFARTNGMSFIDVTDGAHPVYLGNLPSRTNNSIWRDVKVYNNHAFVVSDGNGPHGMQVFDLTTLRNVTSPQTFTTTAGYDSFRSAHNIAINEDTGFAYVVGSNRFAGGLHFINIQNPAAPFEVGGYSGDGYTHDVQVVTSGGPDSAYAGREIAFASNEDTLTIVDVTNKSAPTQLSRKGYANSAYSHQGWLSEDQRYFFLGDELDEQTFGGPTKTHVFDVSDINNPIYVGAHSGTNNAIDHNLYVKGNYIFEANYRSGVRILEMTNPATATLTEVGYIDTYPGSNSAQFNGAWSVYPYFNGGKFIISDIERGLFVAKFDLFTFAPGDFNQDGHLNCTDIDALTAAIVGNNSSSTFDLNGDGMVNLLDRGQWLTAAATENLGGGSYVIGDANLDGVVDTADFGIWSDHRFTQSSSFCYGDFNTDGAVDVSDFHEWNEHKFGVANAQVPEPVSDWLAIAAGCGILSMVRRKSMASVTLPSGGSA